MKQETKETIKIVKDWTLLLILVVYLVICGETAYYMMSHATSDLVHEVNK